jgi:radical SAM superfamily enzyme YgiQ (UPF0313 family)
MTQTHGVRDFAFYDDALLYKAENHAIPLLHGIARSLPGIRLHSPNGLHARWLDRPVIESMNNAGWETIRLGYETGEKRFRADTGAKTGEADLARCVGSLFEAGFSASQVGVYIMAGLPEQTPEAVLKEIAFIGSLGVMAKPVCISPVPGTPLFGHYRKHYPFLADDPLSQNDTFFITCLPGWGWEAVERIRAAAREANRVVAEAPASPNVQDASLI